MGSFTASASSIIMNSLFRNVPTPGSGVDLVPLTATATTAAGYKIYNSVTGTASQVGIYCATGASTVPHVIDLVLGSTGTNGTSISPGNGLLDANFTLATASVGGISGTTTAGGTVTYPTGTGYTGYTGMVHVNTGGTTHTWQGWTLSAEVTSGTAKVAQAVQKLQIGFPTSQSGSSTVIVHGFVLSSRTATNAATASSTQLLASASTSAMPLIVAYGDLSTIRTVSAGDTPVFADGAITVTLD